MIVKDILLEAADLLGMKPEVEAFFNGDGDDYEAQALQLLTCYHVAECALALNYFPLYIEDELLTATGRLDFSSFSQSPVRIIRVTNMSGVELPYTLYPSYIKTDVGRIRVQYSYTPSIKTVEDLEDLCMGVPSHLLVYGTLSEYCLSNGLFQEAAIWDKKLKDSVDYLCHTRKCKRLGSRKWI